MTWAKPVEQVTFGGPSAWDAVVIGGVLIPGIARVTVKAPSGIDVKKPRGGKRAAISDDGDPPLQITIDLTLLSEQLEEFQEVAVPVLRSRSKTKGRAPLEFLHPTAEVWGFGTIMVTEITMNHPDPGGTMQVSISAVEWYPQPKPVKPQERKSSYGITNDPKHPWIYVETPVDDRSAYQQYNDDGNVPEKPISPFRDELSLEDI